MSTQPRSWLSQPLHAFGITWLGQFASAIGLGLSNFALSVYVYQRSSSTTQFSLLLFFSSLPALLLSPVAGALVDRWERRKAMLVANLGAGFCTLFLWALFMASQAGVLQLENWHIFVPIAPRSFFEMLRMVAYSAVTPLLVPAQHLGRANGLNELSLAARQILAPLLAGVLLGPIGLQGIILIDTLTLLLGMASLTLVRFPPPPPSAEGQGRSRSMRQELFVGWGYVRTRPGLFQLVLFGFVLNVSVSLAIILLTPLVLSFTDSTRLGWVISSAGLGMLVGGVVMSAWGGSRSAIRSVLGFHLLGGVALLAGALPPSVPLLAGAAALFLFSMPFIMSCMQSLFQRKVPPDLQGRVFAVRRMLMQLGMPVAALVGGPLVDRLFEPALAPGGALADTVGRLTGTGPGRGTGVLLALLGVLCMVNVLLLSLSPRVRRLEQELPDELPGSLSQPPLQHAARAASQR